MFSLLVSEDLLVWLKSPWRNYMLVLAAGGRDTPASGSVSLKWTWRCLNSPCDKPRWLEQSINFLLDPIEKQWIPILLKLLQVNLGHVVNLCTPQRWTANEPKKCRRWFSGSLAIRFRVSGFLFCLRTLHLFQSSFPTGKMLCSTTSLY